LHEQFLHFQGQTTNACAFLLINECLNKDKEKILLPIIDHLGQRDLQIMPLKLGWREYPMANPRVTNKFVEGVEVMNSSCPRYLSGSSPLLTVQGNVPHEHEWLHLDAWQWRAS
jgi:hypothetical protein